VGEPRRAARLGVRGGAAHALLALLAALPDRSGLAFGAALGRSWARFGLPRTRAARVNLRIAFPEWSDAERERVLVASFENLGRGLVELAWLGRRDPGVFAARVRVEGLQHVEAARKRAGGGGLILLTAHFGSWEFFAAAMNAHGFPLTVVQRARDDASLDDVLQARRSEAGAAYLARGSAAFAAVRALERGSMLALPFDQNARAAEAVFVPFFGRLAATSTAPVRLAMLTGAPVVPAFLERSQEDALRHVAHFRPALELAAGRGDAVVLENTRRMTQAIEAEVRRAPQSWTWGHRRWRTQPAGEARPAYRRPGA
jgi:KDO2-lipid IV(A) lauroyltransferase